MNTKANKDTRTRRELIEDNIELRARLDEAEQTLEAIRNGNVDALLVSGPDGDQVYSLTGAERTYRLIVETMNEAALTVDLNMTILFCNQRFCDLVKSPMQDTIGQKLTMFASPAQQMPLRKILSEAQTSPVQRRITLQDTGGGSVSVQLAASLLVCDGSNNLCLVATDLTEIEKQANSIRILREQQQALAESRAELLAANASLSDSRQTAFNVAKDALEARRQAEETSIELRREAAERMRTEDALRESENRLRSFLENSAVIAWLKDEDGGHVFINRNYERRFGVRFEDWNGKTDFDLWHREIAEEFRKDDHEVLSAEGPIEVTEFTLNADGTVSWWLNNKFTFSDASGRRFVGGLGVDITERMRAETALRESEQQFMVLIQNLRSAVALVNEQGEFTIVNQAFLRMFELADNENIRNVNDRDWSQWQVFDEHGGLLDVDEHPVRKAALTRRPVRDQLVAVKAPGNPEIKWIMVNAEPILDDHGNLHLLICTYHDFTERKLAEHALMASESRYRDLAEFIPAMLWSADAQGVTLDHNRRWYDYTGQTDDQAQGDGWMDIIHPDDVQRVDNCWSQSLRSGDDYEIEYRIRRASDGSYRWHSMKARLRKDDQGMPMGWFGTCIDIEDRKQAEEALKENERKLSDIYASMSEGMALHEVIYDESGRAVDYLITEVNLAFENITGIRRRSAVGKKATEVFGDDEAPYLDIYSQVASVGEPVSFETYYPLMDKYFFISVFSPRKGRFATIFQDISTRKLAEEALKNLNDELEAQVALRTAELREKDQILLLQSRQAAMGEMIGNIAHQWRQPLNTLGFAIQQISLFYDLGDLNRENLERSVGTSMELIKHMSKTINDFRNYFRPDKEKAEFKVNEAITKTVSLVVDSFNSQHIGIEIVAQDDPSILGYRNEFAQALLNILNNARDALMERQIKNPRVTITISRVDGRTVITISDNAGGVPEEIMDKIFDPYFTTKGPQDGTGVGLFMSKAIIEKNMGGRITVRNAGEGAQFRIEV